MYIFTYIQYPLNSGPGGAPAGQPLQVPGGKAPSQPRQHLSNRIGGRCCEISSGRLTRSDLRKSLIGKP